jgi:hypothetical protein
MLYQKNSGNPARDNAMFHKKLGESLIPAEKNKALAFSFVFIFSQAFAESQSIGLL